MSDTQTATCYEGPALSGRSAALIEQAAQLGRAAQLGKAAQPEKRTQPGEAAQPGKRALFVCGKPFALQHAREQLQAAGAPFVDVCCANDVALRVLSTPEARNAYGREGRLLEPYEEAILFEDMKASQFKNRRLRKVLAYLYAGWANLSDDTWEQTYEEDMLIERLHSNLQLTGGVLQCEAANLALHVLREHEGVREKLGYAAVFVDDYDLLSRASQQMLQLLAQGSLYVSAGVTPSAPLASEPYPCFGGARELQAHTIRLHAPVAAKQQVQVEQVQVQVQQSIEEELQAIAVAANEALERNESVLVVGANKLWRKNVVSNLARVGLPIKAMPDERIRLKDYRDPKQCAHAEADALGRLTANPHDGVAWRTLMSLGDAVARSAAIDHLRQAVTGIRVDGRPVRLHEALDMLEAGEITGDALIQPLYDDLLAAYRNAKAKLAEYQKSPAQAYNEGGCFEKGSIAVASPEQAVGKRFDTVIFGGCVNGLIPVRGYFDPAGLAGEARKREWERCERLFGSTHDCARTQFIATAFTTCSLQAAEMMDVHIESIKLHRGVRTAKVQPSELLQGLREAIN